MEARVWRLVILLAAFPSLGAGYRTTNFLVKAPSAELAAEIGQAAEQYRRDLSLEWLGHELPRWSEPCPITVQVGNLGAGGVTQFNFGRDGEVFGWQMAVQGSRKRILDSVLPHEVTHTIFATHFKQPLPRWADEGACTTVEHSEERARQKLMLVHFLQNGKGISFTKMFAMMEYPRDMLPLYAQGYSLARFFIEQGGRRRFVEYVGDGLSAGQWEDATLKHYGYKDMFKLQEAWLDWVRRGSPKLETATLVASAGGPSGDVASGLRDRPEPDLIFRGQSDDSQSNETRLATTMAGPLVPVDAQTVASRAGGAAPGDEREDGWRAIGETRPLVAAAQHDENVDAQVAAGSEFVRNQVTRPPNVERSRQVILEWSRQPSEVTAAAQAIKSPPSKNPARRRSIYDTSAAAGRRLRR